MHNHKKTDLQIVDNRNDPSVRSPEQFIANARNDKMYSAQYNLDVLENNMAQIEGVNSRKLKPPKK